MSLYNKVITRPKCKHKVNNEVFTNTISISVIVSEGYMSPFIGFIKSGECHILRQVEVMHALPNGKRVCTVNSSTLDTQAFYSFLFLHKGIIGVGLCTPYMRHKPQLTSYFSGYE